MKKILVPLLAAALALPAAAEELHYNLVEFHESASVRVPHDTMHIMLEVSETAPSREAAANRLPPASMPCLPAPAPKAA